TGGIPDTGAESPHKVEFTFYDQTEGAPAYGATGFDTRSDLASATIYMAVSMADAEEPKATREDLFWKAKGATDDEGNNNNSVAWEGSTPLGHIDLGADLPDTFKTTGAAAYTKDETTYPAAEMDRDSKASGKIVLRGKVSDNKMLYHIYLKIPAMSTNFGDAKNADPDFGYNAAYGYMAATYNASAGTWTMPVATDATLSSYGIKFTVTNSKVKASGHTADWEFVWDTSYINNVAAADVTVDVYASDQVLTSAVDAGGAYTSLNGTAKYTAPAPQEKNVSGSTAATAGNKPATLQLDVVPYITGLTTMLSGKGVDSARSAKGHWPVYYHRDSPNAANQQYTGAAESFNVNGFNFASGNGALAGQSRTASGYFVVTRGATGLEVMSLNNINNNDAKLSGTDYDNAYNRQPNGRNNNLLTDDVYVDVWQLNNRAAVLGNQTIEQPVMKINPAAAANGRIGFAFKYGTGTQQYAMPNGTGNSYTTWHTGKDTEYSVTFNYDANGASYSTVADGDTAGTYSDYFAFSTSIWGKPSGNVITGNASRIEMIGQKGKKTGDTTTKFYSLATKHQSPVIATAGTNVYLAYYDSFNQELRFRSNLGTAFTNNNKGHVGNFEDQYTGTGEGNIPTYATTKINCQIVAEEGSTAQGGEYVSMAAIPKSGSMTDDVVVIVWFDTKAKKMWYSYNTTPSSDRKGTTNTQTDAAGDGWKKPVQIFGSKASGQYCKVAVDGNGGVHIAAYDSTSGSVWYAYLDDYTNPGAAETCRVDSGNAGKGLTIDVALNEGKTAAIPCIGYYSSVKGLPKYARLAEPGSVNDGISGGKYTGNWEVAYVPSDSIVKEDNINIGLWKTADGAIKYSTQNGQKTGTVGKSYYGNTGDCYGNGSQNAVLGYKHTDPDVNSKGYLETAQLTGTPEEAY
ncbi:MAG: hypothetical protein IJL24_02060, partial [Treponema sp.]|nr:hypothetical protein [Treponema sp.]